MELQNGKFTMRDRERLVRVEDAVADLCKDLKDFMKQAKSEEGFPRCSARKIKWDQVKDHQDKVESFITWFYRSIVGATFLAGLGMVWSHWDDIIASITTLP